jgi:hypothetical protein
MLTILSEPLCSCGFTLNWWDFIYCLESFRVIYFTKYLILYIDMTYLDRILVSLLFGFRWLPDQFGNSCFSMLWNHIFDFIIVWCEFYYDHNFRHQFQFFMVRLAQNKVIISIKCYLVVFFFLFHNFGFGSGSMCHLVFWQILSNCELKDLFISKI